MLSKSRYFENKVLEIGQLSRTLKKILSLYADDPEAVDFIIHETLPDGTGSHQFNKSYSDLEIICDTSKQSIETRFKGKEDSYIGFAVHGYDSYFRIDISCEDPTVMNQLYNAIINELNLEVRISPNEKLDLSIDSIVKKTDDIVSEIES